MDVDGNRPPTHVVNIRKFGIKNLKSRLRDKSHIYIGRNLNKYVVGSKPDSDKWGNPYSLFKYSRAESLEKYEAYARKHLWDQLHELAGKTLACWCHPLPCHGHVLIKLYKEKYCHPTAHIESSHDGETRVCGSTATGTPR